MARPSEGRTLVAPRPPKQPYWLVRFTARGRQWKLSTGESRKDTAAIEADRIFAAVTAGTYTPSAPHRRREAPLPARTLLAPLVGRWMSDAVGRDFIERTAVNYAAAVNAHLLPAFPAVEDITPNAIAAYTEKRLGQVEPGTVKYELVCLRHLVRWLNANGHPTPAQEVPGVPKGAKKRGGTRKAQFVSPEEARAILRQLPATDSKGRPIRLRYAVTYETSLRKRTITTLRTPDHYRPGDHILVIADENDKVRNGREVPLSRRARLYLYIVARRASSGLLFAPADYRRYLKAAAIAVLGPERGASFQENHDWRRNRITHWLERSANIPGTMHAAGHLRLETTAGYVRASKRAATAMLEEVDE